MSVSSRNFLQVSTFSSKDSSIELLWHSPANKLSLQMERVFLQFGEVANSSLVHLWNYSSYESGFESLDLSVRTKLFGPGMKPKTLIYSERIGLKGIISQGPIEGPADETSGQEDRETLINQKTGRWTDTNYGTEFSESSYRELNQFDPTRAFLASFYDSKSKASFLDDFEEDTRKLAETCDWLEGFNLASEACGSIGASTLHALEFLNDEYTKQAKAVLSVNERIKVESIDRVHWENCDEFDGKQVGKALKLALTYEAIKEHNVTFIPVSPLSQCTWNPFGLNLKEAREACRFFSAIYFDLFGGQSVPCQGKFGSLMTSIPNHQTFNFSSNRFIQASLSKWRKSPIVLDSNNYRFDTIDLITYVDFDAKPVASEASKYLETVLNQPRPVWQLLESANVASELAAGDYFQELTETLHQIKDSANFPEDLY